MHLADRLLTIAITATLTSAAWVVFGSAYIDRGRPAGPVTPADQAEVAEAGSGEGASSPATQAARAPLERGAPVRPGRAEVSRLMIPVAGVRPDQLVDSFTDGRDEGLRLHEAIDIMAPTGTAVVAAAAGSVERVFNSEAGGNTIYIRTTDRETIHYYAHLDGYAPGLREGQQVRRGQRLGTVGSSGNAEPTASHLHFAILRTAPDAEWWEPATALNPYRLLAGR